MALIKCRDCGGEVSKKAKACRRCGRPLFNGERFLRNCGMVAIAGAIWVAYTGEPSMDPAAGQFNGILILLGVIMFLVGLILYERQ